MAKTVLRVLALAVCLGMIPSGYCEDQQFYQVNLSLNEALPKHNIYHLAGAIRKFGTSRPGYMSGLLSYLFESWRVKADTFVILINRSDHEHDQILLKTEAFSPDELQGNVTQVMSAMPLSILFHTDRVLGASEKGRVDFLDSAVTYILEQIRLSAGRAGREYLVIGHRRNRQDDSFHDFYLADVYDSPKGPHVKDTSKQLWTHVGAEFQDKYHLDGDELSQGLDSLFEPLWESKKVHWKPQ